jgi:cation:H+ antiporter
MKYVKPALLVLLVLAAGWLCLDGDLLRIALGVDSGPTLTACVVLLALGMVVITYGGDLFTESAVAIARATRIPPVIVGGTLVSMATTFPEFMVSFTGAVQDKPDFAVGNALGSCVCNIGLIVGLCGLLNGWVSRKTNDPKGIPINRVTILGPGVFMLVAGLLVYAFSWFDDGGIAPEAGEPMTLAISRWQAGVLALMFVAYLGYSARIAYLSRYEIRGSEAEAEAEEFRRHLALEFLYFLLGAAVVVIGSRMLIANAEKTAADLGVPPLWIGLTVLAIGTSLPELTISVLAVVKRHGSLGLGNIIGANILNIGWVMASCAAWSPLRIREQTVLLDGPVMLLLMIVMLAGAYRRERVSPRLGCWLFGIYIAYFVAIATLFNN